MTATLLGLLIGAAGLLPTTPAHGQYFGRNKVLWETFDFEILDTEHFSIYHYPPRSAAVDDVARLSERWYTRLSSAFGHEFEHRNPLIIYADHSDFQQTLTTSGLIGEGTGGFTESLQNRVVLPLTGVNADNDHVLGHELVHAFQFDRLEHLDRAQGESAPQLPLWMTEGLAEYLSQGRHDAHTALWLRDAVLFDMLPDPENMSRLALSPYRYGQAVWAYLGGRFGDRIALQLFDVASRIGLAAAVRQELDVEPEALLADFHASLRDAYGPVIDSRLEAHEIARLLGHRQAGSARLNIGPSLSPDGTKLAFMSSIELFTTDLYLADVASGEILTKLVSEETDPHYDYLSFIDSSVAWSPDGHYLAFTVFARGDRRIVLYDVERRRIDRELPLAGVKGVSDPAWSPDGRYLAFSAIVDGQSDLYRVDVATSTVTRLTADGYTAIQPTFAPDGKSLVFVTDLGPQTDLATLSFGPLQLARLDLVTLAIERLPIFPSGKHIDPHFTPDGRGLLFIGEPDGVPDVFRYDLETRAVTRLTALKTGVAGITASSPALT
ncbi:MAG TPA: peptidase S9, partial [Gammaproteobacteria bacterium]